ncbi:MULTISPECIES: hypothetical protein [Salinicola]|uniref:hypothetical protein n=1 Tax=Salinicola TaxID=404432 RepID=UPI0013008C90|nr:MULTISPECIES: hypothetical protein [Salinicola]MDF3920226.1 hypothetical protein [Salinicola salarius]
MISMEKDRVGKWLRLEFWTRADGGHYPDLGALRLGGVLSEWRFGSKASRFDRMTISTG